MYVDLRTSERDATSITGVGSAGGDGTWTCEPPWLNAPILMSAVHAVWARVGVCLHASPLFKRVPFSRAQTWAPPCAPRSPPGKTTAGNWEARTYSNTWTPTTTVEEEETNRSTEGLCLNGHLGSLCFPKRHRPEWVYFELLDQRRTNWRLSTKDNAKDARGNWSKEAVTPRT